MIELVVSLFVSGSMGRYPAAPAKAQDTGYETSAHTAA